MGAMVKNLILHRRLAFFVSVSLSDRPGYLPALIVFKFDDEPPLCRDGILGHTKRLYSSRSKNTRYCVIDFSRRCVRKNGAAKEYGRLTGAADGSTVSRESFCLLRQRRWSGRNGANISGYYGGEGCGEGSCGVGCWGEVLLFVLRRSISSVALLYRSCSRSACVASPSFTCLSRFSSASL